MSRVFSACFLLNSLRLLLTSRYQVWSWEISGLGIVKKDYQRGRITIKHTENGRNSHGSLKNSKWFYLAKKIEWEFRIIFGIFERRLWHVYRWYFQKTALLSAVLAEIDPVWQILLNWVAQPPRRLSIQIMFECDRTMFSKKSWDESEMVFAWTFSWTWEAIPTIVASLCDGLVARIACWWVLSLPSSEALFPPKNK